MEANLELAGESEPPICLASFSNGKFNYKCDLSGDSIHSSLYQRKGPGRRRTLVTRTDHVTYVGTNYETGSNMAPSPFRKYMVGVLDKEAGTMKLHEADIFQMMPFIKGRTDTVFTETNASSRERLSREEYSEAFDKMMSSFGSARAKKAWSANKRNKVDSQELDMALAPAISHAEEEMRKNHEDSEDSHVVQRNPYIPICNTDATAPEDVYRLSDVISEKEMELLARPARNLIEASPETIKTWHNNERYCSFVLSHLMELRGSTALERASMLLYCEYLITLFKLSPKSVAKFGLKKSKVPEMIHSCLLEKFTEQGTDGAGKSCAFTQRMKDKVLAYLFVTALKLCGYSMSSAQLQKDLQVQSKKMTDVFRALGCTVVVDKKLSQLSGPKHYSVTLKIPLVFPQTSKAGQKRRR